MRGARHPSKIFKEKGSRTPPDKDDIKDRPITRETQALWFQPIWFPFLELRNLTTTTIDTVHVQPTPFDLPSIQASTAALVAGTVHVPARDVLSTRNLEVQVGLERFGPVFIQDTEGSADIQMP